MRAGHHGHRDVCRTYKLCSRAAEQDGREQGVMPVADDEYIDVVSFAKLVDALHYVVGFFRLAIYGYVPLLADFFRCAVRPLVS